MEETNGVLVIHGDIVNLDGGRDLLLCDVHSISSRVSVIGAIHSV